MISRRRFAVLSIATLLAGLVLVTAVANHEPNGPSVAGIEREGDIPLPVALG